MSRQPPATSHQPSAISSRLERTIVVALIAAFVALAVGFSLGPILEGPDELEHYRFVRELAQTGALPDPRRPQEEFHQPPLYYTLAALIKAPIDDSDFARVELNPYHLYHQHSEHAILGNDNKNRLIHPRAESFPFTGSGTALAVHLIRLLSVAFGAGLLIVCYAIFCHLWPDRPDRRLAALGLAAFWPLMLFISGVISNDALAILLTTLSLLLALRQMRDGPSWPRAVVLGVVLGAALLTKASALLLAIPVGLAVLLDLRRAWRYALLTLALALAISGWWYVRNWMLSGDPTAMQTMYISWPDLKVQPGQLPLFEGLGRMSYVYQRLWVRFGANTIAVASLIYRFFDLLTITGLIGAAVCLVRWWRDRAIDPLHQIIARQVIVLAVFALTLLAATVRYTLTNWAGDQGRFLLPGLAIWAALLALGLDAWTPRRVRLPIALSGVALMATIAAVCLFGYYFPAYRPTPAPAHIDHPLALRYGDAAGLIGVEPAITRARPGDTVRITLIWRAIEPTATSLQAYLHSTPGEVVWRDSLPATGNLLSTDWLPGQTWAEDYLIPIPADAEEQMSYLLVAGLYDPQTEQTIPALDANGNEVTPTVGRIAINGPSQPFAPDYVFAGIIGLAQPTITRDGDQIETCLRYVSLATTDVDYHFFVHVLDAGGQIAAQSDFQPKAGQYPTSAWSPGEVIAMCVPLSAPGVPQSGWRVATGLYDVATDLRLPVVDASGQALPDDRVVISP